ncbi:S-adenosylmethionine uptake transporter [Azospirillum thiophilum]|uniref:S-adenosylmethionine uptake transporter n=1 Tax=Azospirillum thiophilum TaxID=528244 RepID=A0AAC8W1Z9_9PROT|nr:DMT family transporter [Azospirillum thiophilum]ALG73664.1 S-adenosylmethionine uptake transporter [Azospirillum thiophilum]KJR63052.1 S-adenosylmethionine uptake transporter [Azospirillum thiophilum]
MTDAETADLLPAEADSVPYAVGCFLIAILLFAAMDTLIKVLTADYPVPQLMFVRSLVAFLLVGGYTLVRGGGIAAMRTRRPWGHVWRAFAGLISMGCFFYAFRELPLADVYVLSFAGPLFITALSAPLLGEPVGWRRWAAVVVGFGGVVVMAQPSAGAPLVPVLVGLVAALFYALAALAVRGLSRTETSASIVLYLLLTTTVVSGALAVPVWTAPTAFGLGLMSLVGVLGAGAQVLLTQAFRRAPPAVVAPFEYTGMVWASLFGWLVFGDLPTVPVLVGAMVIIGSGLYILHRETMMARRRLGS